MSAVHRLDTLIDAMTARHGHSPMGLEMACVRLIQGQHAEIERLRAEIEKLKAQRLDEVFAEMGKVLVEWREINEGKRKA